MKKLVCLIAALVMCFTACGRNNADDMQNPTNDTNVTDNSNREEEKVNNDEMGNGTADDQDGILEDTSDGAKDGAQDIVDGAANATRDAMGGVKNAVDDMTK